MTLSPNIPAWIAIARTQVRIAYTYRLNMLTAILLTGFEIYLLTLVWKAAYGDQTEVAGIGVGQMLVYLTLANLQLRFLRPEMDTQIQERIRQGQIGFDLSRPVGYPSQLLAAATGDMIGLLPMLVVAFPVAFDRRRVAGAGIDGGWDRVRRSRWSWPGSWRRNSTS